MEPHIAPTAHVREFSFKAIALGMLLGVVFAIGNAYLGLKVGMTISASIPSAVLSMAILRALFKYVTILENNIVQTVAAVGEGLAGGVIFTFPALFILGKPPTIWHMFLLSFLGGLLGILFMIPMRRYIIVKEHGKLPFPEGAACARILIAGEKKSPKAILAIYGLITGALFKIASGVLHLYQETVSYTLKFYENTVFSIDCTPALMGVGYIIGPHISAVMLAGGGLGWWVIIPIIHFFTDQSMNATEIWSQYVRYIGAGAVATGGIISLFKLIPTLFKTVHATIQELFTRGVKKIRTEQDIPLSYLAFGSVSIILFLWLYPGFELNFLSILLLVVLGFFFVAVTSITVGLVGSSSNPISGMVIITLLVTCLIFVAIGWTERIYLIMAITMSGVANITIALAQTTSQDLKTGFLLGATPKKQQIAEMFGLLLPCTLIGGTLYLLDSAYGFGSVNLPAPQASLMTFIAKGVLEQTLPLVLIGIGIVLGFIIHLVGQPVLPFAIGLYLPLSLSTSVAVGGWVSYLLRKNEKVLGNGVITASGLVAGDACTGVVIALLSATHIIGISDKALLGPWFSLLMYAFMAFLLGYLPSIKRNQLR